MVEEVYKKIVINPLADEIQEMIVEEIKSKIPLGIARGFAFFYKWLLVIFFGLVFFWGILLPNLPVKLDRARAHIEQNHSKSFRI